MAPFGLGYMGQGMENVAATLKDESKLQDQKESLNMNLPVREKVWPPIDSLNDTAKEYYEKVQELSSHLMRLFALALNLDESFFDDKVDNAFTVLRLLNYPEQKDAVAPTKDQMENMTRNAEHTDYGTLTILWSPDSRGLQAKNREGEWIDVVAPVDHFIINIGDLMSNWTNDKWVRKVLLLFCIITKYFLSYNPCLSIGINASPCSSSSRYSRSKKNERSFLS